MNFPIRHISGLTFILVLFLFISSGCTQRVLDFTIISSKQVEMRVDESGKGRSRVEGKHGVHWILFFPLGEPNLKEAVDRAIEAAGPGYDALIDGVIYSENYWYVFYGYSGYKVVGTPIKTAELKAELLRNDKDVDSALQRLLFHSSLGISNEEVIKEMGLIDGTSSHYTESSSPGKKMCK